MNYWERWIGDWKRKTAHLSFEEKGAYGELLDHLYANDTYTLPVQREAVYRIAGAQVTSERKAVDAVLEQFFVLDDVGHHNKRAMQEIEKRRAYIENQRLMGKRRWEKAEPAEPREKQPKANGVDVPEWIPKELYLAWWGMRKAKSRTEGAHKLALRTLEKLKAEGHEPTAVLEHCIIGGYQGIFAPHTANGKHVSPPPAQGVKCAYCPEQATKWTNDIPHCARADHLDFAIARRT